MRIERVIKSEGKTEKYVVLFDDGTEIKVTAVQIADYGIYSGRELPDEDYAELRGDLAVSSAKTRALRILGNRNLSAREIEKRLVRKGESSEAAEQAVEWLENIGAINDAEYAESIVRHYSSKGYGVARIRDELFRRGIDRELWEEALSIIGDMEDTAYEFLVKKLRGSRDKDELRRAADTLHRRGFSYDEARAAVRRYMGEAGAEDTEGAEETEDSEL